MISIILRIVGVVADWITIFAASVRRPPNPIPAQVGFVFLRLPDGSPARARLIDPLTKESLRPDNNGMIELPLDRTTHVASIRDGETSRELRTVILDIRAGHTMRIQLEEVQS